MIASRPAEAILVRFAHDLARDVAGYLTSASGDRSALSLGRASRATPSARPWKKARFGFDPAEVRCEPGVAGIKTFARLSTALIVYTNAVYTVMVTGKLDGFEWDAANVGHVLHHAVTPLEVEEAVGRPHIVIPAETIQGEERWKLFGTTAANQRLVVVFTVRRNLFRTVTAYSMNAAERRKYAPQIE